LEFGVKTGQGGYSYEDLVKVWSAAEELVIIEGAAKRRSQSPSEFRKKGTNRGFIVGKPDECVGELRKFKEAGVNELYISFTGDREIEPLRTFKDKVIPELR
jgi:alkanesulfonate monooxygenase SsuD/methylene tetrahydromethanopterin reductase-like flavin-dependent oxidoreductase (luciferase family)